MPKSSEVVLGQAAGRAATILRFLTEKGFLLQMLSKDWFTVLNLHLVTGVALRFRLQATCNDALTALPRGLLNDPRLHVASVVLRKCGVLATLRLCNVGADIYANFKCPYCEDAASASRHHRESCTLGSRVRITQKGHWAVNKLGLVARQIQTIDAIERWSIRLDDGRSATINGRASCLPEPTRLCHHFVGGQGLWFAPPKPRRTKPGNLQQLSLGKEGMDETQGCDGSNDDSANPPSAEGVDEVQGCDGSNDDWANPPLASKGVDEVQGWNGSNDDWANPPSASAEVDEVQGYDGSNDDWASPPSASVVNVEDWNCPGSLTGAADVGNAWSDPAEDPTTETELAADDREAAIDELGDLMDALGELQFGEI